MIFSRPLVYFSELSGGPKNGYKYLRDSNLDWGQGLKELAVYLKKEKSPEVALYYPWPAPPDHYGISSRPMTENEMEHPDDAVYAVSVHVLDNVKWLKDVKPTAEVGYSIFVYDMRKHGG